MVGIVLFVSVTCGLSKLLLVSSGGFLINFAVKLTVDVDKL